MRYLLLLLLMSCARPSTAKLVYYWADDPGACPPIANIVPYTYDASAIQPVRGGLFEATQELIPCLIIPIGDSQNPTALYEATITNVQIGDIGVFSTSAEVTTEIDDFVMFCWYIAIYKDDVLIAYSRHYGTNISHLTNHHYPFNQDLLYQFHGSGTYVVRTIIYSAGAPSGSRGHFEVNQGYGSLRGIILREGL